MIHLNDSTRNNPLRMPWRNAISVGRAYDLVREDLLEHLRAAQKDMGYRYCRFHALFHDDMGVVKKDADGKISYQWHHVDKIYDALLEMGIRPFVELNAMPELFASGTQKMFYYEMNVTPPKRYEDWADLVEAFARHCIARYGLEEVRQWYFEVWNEPNLSGFWSGTKEEYFKLYEAAARALKKVDPKLRVGGPASSKANWITDIIQYCAKGNVPIDFVSTHLYPQDEYVEFQDRKGSPHKVGAFFQNTVRGVKDEVARSPMPHLEIHWTEWNTMSTTSTAGVTWVDNVCVDNLFAASFIVRNALALDDAADTLCYWTVSDIFEEGPIPNAPFTCTYGLMTNTGIPKAAYNAFKLLRQMRGDVLDTTGTAPDYCGVCGTRELDTLRAILWNHEPLELKGKQPAWKDTLVLPIPAGTKTTAISARIAASKGSPWETWVQMGTPQNLTPAQEHVLRAHAEPEWRTIDLIERDGKLALDFTLQPNDVLYIEISPKSGKATGKGGGAMADLMAWDKMMGEQSRA